MAETDNITKVCTKCNEEKQLEMFHKRPSRKSGFTSHCKECVKLKKKENKDRTNKRARERNAEKASLKYKIPDHLKKCTKCKVEKDKVDFCKNSSRKDGIHHTCKTCVKEIANKNKDKNQAYRVMWELLNKDKRREQKRLIQQKWIANHPEYMKEYIAKRIKFDDFYRFKLRVRGLIRKAILRRGFSKSQKTELILGCSIGDFAKYIEGKFTDGMSWALISEIHLDHIIPISTAKTYEDVIRLNHYTNLQPLWAEDNLRKSDKLDFVI